jgi:hypothetical protein
MKSSFFIRGEKDGTLTDKRFTPSMNSTYTTVATGPTSFDVPSNPTFVVILYKYVLEFILLLGFIGNSASITTFMRPILRSTSTGCLFLMLAVSDTMYLLLSLFDFVEVGLVQEPIFLSDYDNFCRFRWFSRGFIRFCSAWILLLIAIDRWVRVCLPFKTKEWCTRHNAFIITSLIIIISIGIHAFLLSPTNLARFFPGIQSLACGTGNNNYSYRYFFFITWSIIQVRKQSIEKNLVF